MYATPGAPCVVAVNETDCLTLRADGRSFGTVTRFGVPGAHHVHAGTPLTLRGPAVYMVELTSPAGRIACVTSPARGSEQFEAKLNRAADNIRSHRIIAAAIIEGRTMALHDKLKNLAARARSVPQAIDAKADEMLGRLDAVAKRGDQAFDSMGAVLTDAEQGVAAAEDAVNQLTNGGPA